MPTFWSKKRVLVSGGGGFIGSSVVHELRQLGVGDDGIVVPRFANCDLRSPDNCKRAVQGCNVVIHLAAPTGGVSFSKAHPASQYLDCSLINLHLLEAARQAGVEKFVALGNLLAYPESAPSPLLEESLQNGKVAHTHLGIGLAKRDMVSLATMYHQEYGMNVINVLAANAYGPGERFDEERSHVIPATIAKCFRDEDLVVWGDGSPTRDFLFVEDIARGILLAAERLPAPDFVNLASGSEVSIGDLVKLIASLCGFRGRILFDSSKGGGDFRRLASTSKATDLIGFTPRISLSEGLERTIDRYKQMTAESVAR